MTALERCGIPDCDLPAEWWEVIVWRHARDKTAGSRVRESDRKLENPGRLCEAHAKLRRLGLDANQMSLGL